ncbi:3-deoxy-manno-octulosonate cytidylyltransferase [bacterium]|nr:3-deoxy-manno-octulosonate cytidylyltransferase [bacterium]
MNEAEKQSDKVIGLIPARYASTRFPGKLLADLNGKPVLQWTWEKACEAESLDRVIIASGDEKITVAARDFGAEVIDVFEDCASGSDRIARALHQLEDDGERFDIVVNIQGDEPLLDPATIDKVVERLLSDPEAGVATSATPIRTEGEYRDSSVVKVVMDKSGRSLYFSRSPIPHGWNSREGVAYCHIGLYAFRRDVLIDFTNRLPCEIEKAERLEQLRLLHHGIEVVVVAVEESGIGIDTEEDLEMVKITLSRR